MSFSSIEKTKWINERTLFYGVLAFNLFLLCTIRFYPSMDGPAHLYNANVIYQLIKGNEVIKAFYAINMLPIPNWTAHIVLVGSRFLMPAWLAEKTFLFMYVIGMALSFRFLIKQLTGGSAALSIFIFPFIYSFLFHLGFYNYCFSFVFLFLSMGCWIKNRDKQGLKKHFILCLLITASYFSNVLGFLFTGVCIALLILSYTINDYYATQKKEIAKKLAHEFFHLFLGALPSLICLLTFYKSITFYGTTSAIDSRELTKWLNDVRPLIVYNYTGEERLTAQFLHIMIAVTAVSCVLRLPNKFYGLKKIDVILLGVIAAVLLLFNTPDGASAGMMSNRYCLMTYVLFTIWVAAQQLPKKPNAILIALIITFHTALLLTHKNAALKGLNNDAREINYVANFVEPNAVVLPVNMSDNWLEGHFSNYLGIDKPLIITENYEAAVGWFPVVWNATMPQLTIAGEANKYGLPNTSSRIRKDIDYVILYGNTASIKDSAQMQLRTILEAHFQQVYVSESKFVALYKYNLLKK